MSKFIEKHGAKICFFAVILGILYAVLFLVAEHNKSIEDQKQNLYAKEQLVVQEITSITDIPDSVTVRLTKDKVYVTIEERDCMLNLTYDKKLNLEGKEFKDTRPSADFSACVFMVLVYGVASFVISALVCLALAILGDFLDKKKQKVKT